MSKVAPRSRPRSPPAVAGDPHGERFADLAAIAMPTLVVNGDLDVLLNTINSFCLQQHLPDAQLIIYPDSGHAPHFQYPALFLAHARIFLNV